MNIFNVMTIDRHRLKADGDGVTTLVGLYGCPLKCKYCINMDFLSTKRFRRKTPEKLWEELSIDYCYYVASGGGVTFGGGESLIYTDSILDFISIIPDGVNVNIETSLNYKSSRNQELFLKVNELIIDIKTLDSELYKQYTGASNTKVIDNLKIITNLGLQNKCKIRIPIIPDFKSKEKALEEANIFKDMGFEFVEVFEYIIKDYMSV